MVKVIPVHLLLSNILQLLQMHIFANCKHEAVLHLSMHAHSLIAYAAATSLFST